MRRQLYTLFISLLFSTLPVTALHPNNNNHHPRPRPGPYLRHAMSPGGKHHHSPPPSNPEVTLTDNSASVASDVPQIILLVDPNNSDSHGGSPVVKTSTAVVRILPSAAAPGVDSPELLEVVSEKDVLVTGVTYAPYNADGTCRTASQVYADFQRMYSHSHPSGGRFDLVRIYGVDCDQVASVLPAANSINVRLFLGIFNLDNLSPQVSTLVSAVQASGLGWGIIDTISVGNELVNNGQASPQQVISAVRAAREMLRSAGYQGPVVTVDTFVAVERHPELCDESDYCAINCHPFFDGYTTAEQAGEFVGRKVRDVREVREGSREEGGGYGDGVALAGGG
ncbi:glycoside hydrolase superfamily [Apiosordaria backusii]|uniref:Glycoside hydrolase superfamily n=1 Tax=Apiosordaria backusii TaxID=314023 RepID=A0AA40ASZ8_9PEZI|nr:glycoside hydrolase superfamily [Apiosordaria backusii]